MVVEELRQERAAAAAAAASAAASSAARQTHGSTFDLSGASDESMSWEDDELGTLLLEAGAGPLPTPEVPVPSDAEPATGFRAPTTEPPPPPGPWPAPAASAPPAQPAPPPEQPAQQATTDPYGLTPPAAAPPAPQLEQPTQQPASALGAFRGPIRSSSRQPRLAKACLDAAGLAGAREEQRPAQPPAQEDDQGAQLVRDFFAGSEAPPSAEAAPQSPELDGMS